MEQNGAAESAERSGRVSRSGYLDDIIGNQQCSSNHSHRHPSSRDTSGGMATARSRILDLMRVSCRIFNTTFNPTGERTGNKILRTRLKGPSLVQYYPKEYLTIKQFKRGFPDLAISDEKEEYRVQQVEDHKLRGKGKPKKFKLGRQRTAGTKKKKAKRK
ncbi:mitochondral 37S ribosomal protein S27 [Orbilia brochopaga]|uniref:Small ribosomal subunit protein mS33 n=1 Tax=Orbilia brochopaga TaxID=3140254 RepID=A0AAV9UR01_9PEZI